MLKKMLQGIVVLSFTMMMSAGTSAADDVRLVIDISGSMKQNDPKNLRIPAVNLLIKLAPPESDVGVWTFGQGVNMLVPHGEVTKQWKQTAISKTAQINSSGLFTNIGAALENVLLDFPGGDAAILLTDGVVDISKDPQVNARERSRILNEILPRLIAKGVIVHSVALSNNTDEALLKELSKSTGGMFEVATSSENLMTLFLKMFDDAVPQDQIPITGNEFVVDKSVQEFTLLVFKKPGEPVVQLKSPANKYYIASEHPGYISWYSDLGFDLITVSEPDSGVWKLFAETDHQNRVTVLSDLRLDVTNLENTIYSGHIPELQVSFQQENRRVINRKFLELMDVQLIVISPDGSKQGTRLAEFNSGIFGSPLQVFDQVGKYQIRVSIDGKSFKRVVVQEIEYQNPIEIQVDQIERRLLVLPAAKSLLADKLNIIASLGSDEAPTSFLPLVEDAEGFWSTSLASFPAGTYRLNLNVSGVTGRGQVVDFKVTGKTIELQSSVSETSLGTDPAQSEVDAVSPHDLVIATELEADDSGQSKSLLASLLSNNYLVYGIVGFLNLLVIFACIWAFRRRSASPEEDQELQVLLAGKSVDKAEDETDVGIEPETATEAESKEEGSLAAAQEETTKEALDDGAAEGFSDIVDGWTAIEEDDAKEEGSAPEIEGEELLSVLDDESDNDRAEDAPDAQEKERALEEAEIAEILADGEPSLAEIKPEIVDEEVDEEVDEAVVEVVSTAIDSLTDEGFDESASEEQPSLGLAEDLELDLSTDGKGGSALDLSIEDSMDLDPGLDLSLNDDPAASPILEPQTVKKQPNV